MTKEDFAAQALSIPHAPGVYRYYNAQHLLLYVGKAKDLRKRVSSYFVKNHPQYKTKKLVAEIETIEFTIVNSEHDALLLESSLIKQFQPKYNIELRDDKSFPYIVIKNENYPRVFVTRRLIKDGSTYLGPYTNVNETYDLLRLLKQTLPIRTCNLVLSDKNIEQKKFKPCLEYHIGNCKAPCVGFQTKENYVWHVQQIKQVLKGKLGDIIKQYKTDMMLFAKEMQYEKAEILKKKIDYLQHYQFKSVIASATQIHADVCSIVSNNELAFVNYMVIVQGNIIYTRTVEVQKKLEETDQEILSHVYYTLSEQQESTNQEVISSFAIELTSNKKLCIPKVGIKKELLDLSIKNVQYFIQDQKRKKSLLLESKDENTMHKVLLALQQQLQLAVLPTHIECFDNSNFQGAYPVSAMVCFKNGIASKKEYRHYHIKTVQGINDFESMKETVYRRYKRLLAEKKELPTLIIIDGGKGQLSSAISALQELQLFGKIPIMGLAKNVEELFFPGDSESKKLDFKSAELNLIRQIRDEVHRFGITFHRKVRSKGIIKNELETIHGIGSETANTLLQQYRSIKNIKATSKEELATYIGNAKATLVYNYFSKKGDV